MKKFIFSLILVFLFSVYVKSQTFSQIAYNMLGQQIDKGGNIRLQTDFGKFTFKIVNKKESGLPFVVAGKITITITNENPLYDSIVSNTVCKDGCEKRIGTLYTDFIYKYDGVITRSFSCLQDAIKYYRRYRNSEIISYHEVSIYKHIKHDKYLVGKFTNNSNGILISEEGKYFSLKKYSKIAVR